MEVSDVCHKFGTPVHKTNHQRYSRGVQKAIAYREQLQISRADACPHLQPKSFDQSLYVLSFYDRVRPVVYGSAKNEQGNKDQTWAACQKNMASNVFLVLLIVLAKKIIKSTDKELEYYLQYVR